MVDHHPDPELSCRNHRRGLLAVLGVPFEPFEGGEAPIGKPAMALPTLNRRAEVCITAAAAL
jgi:hypothetical protein